MTVQLVEDRVVLPPYPVCEKCSRDKHEALYQINYKRFILDSNGVQVLLSRDEVSRWLAQQDMSRVPLSKS